MDIDIALAATYRKNGETFFLIDECLLVKRSLNGVSYEEANKLFEEVFHYYPYPYCLLRQIGFIDDLTPVPLLVYYAALPEKDVPAVGKWAGIEELSRNKVAFMIYGKCITERG